MDRSLVLQGMLLGAFLSIGFATVMAYVMMMWRIRAEQQRVHIHLFRAKGTAPAKLKKPVKDREFSFRDVQYKIDTNSIWTDYHSLFRWVPIQRLTYIEGNPEPLDFWRASDLEVNTDMNLDIDQAYLAGQRSERKAAANALKSTKWAMIAGAIAALMALGAIGVGAYNLKSTSKANDMLENAYRNWGWHVPGEPTPAIPFYEPRKPSTTAR